MAYGKYISDLQQVFNLDTIIDNRLSIHQGLVIASTNTGVQIITPEMLTILFALALKYSGNSFNITAFNTINETLIGASNELANTINNLNDIENTLNSMDVPELVSYLNNDITNRMQSETAIYNKLLTSLLTYNFLMSTLSTLVFGQNSYEQLDIELINDFIQKYQILYDFITYDINKLSANIFEDIKNIRTKIQDRSEWTNPTYVKEKADTAIKNYNAFISGSPYINVKPEIKKMHSIDQTAVDGSRTYIFKETLKISGILPADKDSLVFSILSNITLELDDISAYKAVYLGHENRHIQYIILDVFDPQSFTTEITVKRANMQGNIDFEFKINVLFCYFC